MHRGPEQRSAARVRGLAAGAVSATLALAAHGGASGTHPGPTGVLLLLATAVIVVALGCCPPGLRWSRCGLFALLSAGQLAGHAALTSAGHQHGGPSTAMVAAHVAAVAGCAVIIALAERIAPRCAAALRRVKPRLFPPIPAVPVRPALVRRVDYPTQLRSVLAASVPRRGPPLAV